MEIFNLTFSIGLRDTQGKRMWLCRGRPHVFTGALSLKFNWTRDGSWDTKQDNI